MQPDRRGTPCAGEAGSDYLTRVNCKGRSAGFSPNKVKQPCRVWSLGRKLAWVDPCKRGRDLGFSVGVESKS